MGPGEDVAGDVSRHADGLVDDAARDLEETVGDAGAPADGAPDGLLRGR